MPLLAAFFLLVYNARGPSFVKTKVTKEATRSGPTGASPAKGLRHGRATAKGRRRGARKSFPVTLAPLPLMLQQTHQQTNRRASRFSFSLARVSFSAVLPARKWDGRRTLQGERKYPDHNWQPL